MKNQLFAVVALSAIIFLTSLNLVAGQVRRPGKCPNVSPQPNFILKDYFGKWWIQQKYPAFFVKGGHCATAEHQEIGENQFSVIISQLDEDNKVVDNKGTGRVVGNAHFLERFQKTPPGVEFDYYILYTNYTGYTILYRCDEAGDEHDEFMWILSRKQEPKPKVIKALRDAIVAYGFAVDELQVVNNKNC